MAKNALRAACSLDHGPANISDRVFFCRAQAYLVVILKAELIGKGWSMRGKNFIVSISLASMVFQPVALAEQNNQKANQALKEFVKANQPGGQSLTVKKFWDQNKKGINPYWQQVFNPSIQFQKNQKMPKMEAIDIKGPRGTSSERLIMNIDGKTVSVEFLGGEEKFARINNIVISYADFYYVTGMLEKLSKEPVLAAENKKAQQKVLTQSATPTYEQYKLMTPKERAQLLLMTRLAGEAASDVLMLAAEAEDKKTASNFFWEALVPQANAKVSSVIGLPCLVGGYEGKIVRKGKVTCDPSAGIAEFNSKNPKLAQSSGCTGGSFGCHPVNFPASTGICFGKNNRKDMQNMTKQCGERSPYKTPQDQAKLIEEYQKRLGNNVDVKLNAEGKVLDEKTYNEIVRPYMDQFNELNRSAFEKVCNPVNRLKVEKTVDPEIDSACNTLEQRKISLELFKEAPRPADPAPVPVPIADRESCTIDGKPGKYDKEGKCVLIAVGTPSNDCNSKGLTDPPAVGKIPTRVNGAKDDCIVAATERLPGAVTGGAAKTPPSPSFFNTTLGRIVSFTVIGGIIAWLWNRWTKVRANVSPPIAAQPPASPPLPAAPVQHDPNPTAPAIEGGTGTSPSIAAPESQIQR